MLRRPAEALLEALRSRTETDLPVAVVVAHPDDETIGAGPLLRLLRNLRLLHLTDGAPQDMRDVAVAGFSTCAVYASARQQELQAAMQAGGAAPILASVPGLPVADQSASWRLSCLAETLRTALADVAVVLTHAFEGGHPDHDATSFAVQRAGLPRVEMAGYRASDHGGIEIGTFLSGCAETVIALSAEERERRDAMLACFTTQRPTLAPFFGASEMRFRQAPSYDFLNPPFRRAYYDDFHWGLTSERWRELAAEALRC